jgi:hypothetical protein
MLSAGMFIALPVINAEGFQMVLRRPLQSALCCARSIE